MLNYKGSEVGQLVLVKNGVSTDVKLLKYSGKYVFAKKLNLSKTSNTGGTLTVTRTRNAYLTLSESKLEAGKTLFYGDFVKISASPSLNYRLDSLKVNGELVSNMEIAVTSDLEVTASFSYATCSGCRMNNNIRCSSCNMVGISQGILESAFSINAADGEQPLESIEGESE